MIIASMARKEDWNHGSSRTNLDLRDKERARTLCEFDGQLIAKGDNKFGGVAMVNKQSKIHYLSLQLWLADLLSKRLVGHVGDWLVSHQYISWLYVCQPVSQYDWLVD